jgi:hypothetical protein
LKLKRGVWCDTCDEAIRCTFSVTKWAHALFVASEHPTGNRWVLME